MDVQSPAVVLSVPWIAQVSAWGVLGLWLKWAIVETKPGSCLCSGPWEGGGPVGFCPVVESIAAGLECAKWMFVSWLCGVLSVPCVAQVSA